MKLLFIRKIISGSLFSVLLACAPTPDKSLPQTTFINEQLGIHKPLKPEESQKLIQVPEGFAVELFAAEPNIINPIALAWDERGRLWVVQSMATTNGTDNDVGGNRITICEDTDSDGKADKFTDFATHQGLSTGIVIVKGGAIVAQAPNMLYLEDRNGDDKMDKHSVLFHGFSTLDTHAGPGNLKYGYDNMIWGTVGTSGVEYSFQDKTSKFEMGIYRFSKDGRFFEPVGQFDNNTWGLGFNENLEIFGSTANNNHACHIGIPLRYYNAFEQQPTWAINADFIQGHYDMAPIMAANELKQDDVKGGFTSATGANFYTAANYPAAYRNQMYVNAPTGHLVHRARIEESGAAYKEVDGGNIFASTDTWTAPVYTETGPDGNLWIADWYNPIIQHDPNEDENAEKEETKDEEDMNQYRDFQHGRIYILRHKDQKKPKITSLDPSTPKELLQGLQSPNMFWRITAQRLIVEHQLIGLTAELKDLAETNSLAAMHALWTLDGLGMLKDKDVRANNLLATALSSNSEGTQRTALALLPKNELGSELLAESGLLESENLRLRLAAILCASEMPTTNKLKVIMEKVTIHPKNQEDKWLRAAVQLYLTI